MVQQRPYFVRQSQDSNVNSNSDAAAAEPVSGTVAVSISGDEGQDEQEERTPLTPPRTVDQNDLVDTPEYSASWFSRLTFSWLNDLLAKGVARQIGPEDLYKLDAMDMPAPNWRKYLGHHGKSGRRSSLLIALLWTFAPELALQGVLALASSVLHFSGPFFLQRILRHDARGEVSLRGAYLDAFGLLLFTVLVSLLSQQAMWIGRRVGIRLKGVLVGELAATTLKRRGKGGSSEDKADREDKPKASDSIVNLLTADFQRVSEVSAYLDSIYSMPLMLLIGIWYMYALLGISALVGLSIAIIYAPLSKHMLQYVSKIETKLNALSDQRVTAITELLQGIKTVKLFGWESRFLARIDERRERQLAYMWRVLLCWAYIMVVSTLAPMLVLIVIFGVYVVGFKQVLTAEVAFTAIAVFQQVRMVFERLPGMLNWVVGGYVSLGRIDEYLRQPQIQRLEDRLTPLVGGRVRDTQSYATLSHAASAPGRFGLRNLNVRFPRGRLSLVGGPTGAGKSSLLAALVGEMTLTRGHLLLPVAGPTRSLALGSRTDSGMRLANIAYVSQEAWLRNATIRENILFGAPYNASRYEEVLRVCALKADLRILAAGDLTEIGERGVTLSGGQKQRVALARAVYSERQILLIDDCLSAVDAHTARVILSECLVGGGSSSGLMRGRTRVLVSHHMAMCLPHCSYVAMMRGGEVVMSGAPHELQQQTGAFSDLGAFGQAAPVGALVEDEEREEGGVKLAVWLVYLRSCGSGWYWGISLALMVTCQALVVAQDYWVRLWVAATGAGGSQQHSAVFWLGMYVVIGVAGVGWRLAQMLFVYSGAIRASRQIHTRLLRAIVRATPRFFDATPLGRIMNRVSRDMQVVDELTMDTMAWWFMDILAVLSVFAIISLVVPAFVLVAGAVSAVYFAIARHYLATSRELKRLEANSMSPLLSLFGELILGVSSIRAFGASHCYVREALARIAAHNRAFYMVWSANRWLSIRIDAAGASVSFACALFVLSSLDWLDAGLAGFALSYALTFSDHMLWVIRNYSSNELNMNAVERLEQYTRVRQEAALHTAAVLPAGWPRRGDVAIEDLLVEYVPGVPVLHGISLAARHGERIGVVGRTGAGKSTLSLALLRFVEAARGRITLDGVDIAAVGLEDLRRSVTIIPQDPVLFNGSIRFNLDPFGEYPDALVWDALHRAHLTRHDPPPGSQATITADSAISDNGHTLSLGQRQLVALARALLRRSRLIIMDEATASVDFDTDERIQRTIRGSEFGDSTLFCIAHRLRTVIDYDRVLVLDKGRIAEFDTPCGLLQREAGLFRAMCEKSGEFERLYELATTGVQN
ncbi:P-loop containing nucleoside triphosphate hydrolase protein [Kickxella alabastrina]|uniref:P-loop containing nucleoside triphosphate hydrolase protein n=1 Tax=Kickxella alabastrina TaxID=61397 RepID=UPI0022205280|nr:P-loop containing nucleoside triphosphate hydrolase protein [Kickxella alabastrina]KAI7829941.1 P-loop containing nucleoside triphosphate hydrolase protein [Kickxella alabastrina]